MNASIIGLVNQKGGTGKTTTCVNLGIDLAREGKKVLIADCDPQGSATISLGHPQPDALPVTLTELMGKVLNDEPISPGEGILHHEEYHSGGNGGVPRQRYEPGNHAQAGAR